MAKPVTRKSWILPARKRRSGLLHAAMYPPEEPAQTASGGRRGQARLTAQANVRRPQTPTFGQMIAAAYLDGRDTGPFTGADARQPATAERVSQQAPQPAAARRPSIGATVGQAYYNGRDTGPFALLEAQHSPRAPDAAPRDTPARTYMLDPAAMPNFRIKLAPNPDANGQRPWNEFPGFSGVDKYDPYIVEAAKRHGVDPDVVRAILHMETTHGQYDKITGLFAPNKSILPMNVNQKYWGNAFGPREELKRPENNIDQGTRMIAQIQKAMPGASLAEIATVYNNINATKVEDYGARVQRIYEERPWENPRPALEPPVNVYVGG